MATIPLTIPDSYLPRVIAAICGIHGYSPTLENGSANPESPAQFTKRMIANELKNSVIHWESEADAAAARQAAIITAQKIEIT